MFVFETRIERSGRELNLLVVFSGQLEGDSATYGNLFETNLYSFPHKPDELVFIYPDYLKEFVDKMLEEAAEFNTGIRRYGADVITTIAPFDKNGNLTPYSIAGNTNLAGNPSFYLEKIVHVGLKRLAEDRKESLVRVAPSGSVFTKPSGDVFDEFIAAGELAIGYSENQFVAFCLLSKAPKNRELKKIYIDSNSISTFVECIIYYWSKFSDSECKPAIYKSFNSYEGMIREKPETIGDIWVIVSASASNNMGQRLYEEWGLESSDQVITILSFAEARPDVPGTNPLVNISFLSKSILNSSNTDQHVKLEIRGENFTAEIEKPTGVVILAAHSPSIVNDWVSKICQKDYLSLNKRSDLIETPKPITVDAHKYLKNDPDLKRWLKIQVEWFVPKTCKWIIYVGDSSRSLAEEIYKLLDKQGQKGVEIISSEDAPSEVTGPKSVLIVKDVVTDGSALLKLNSHLRLAKHGGNRIFIAPFVLFDASTNFEKTRRSLVFAPEGRRYPFLTYKSVYMGHADGVNSWKLELNLVNQLDGNEFWKIRAAELGELSQGLGGKIGITGDGSNKLEFAQDFAFWPPKYDPTLVNPAAVYLTIASILQNLRETPNANDGKGSLFVHAYQHSVISPENFSRFNDPLIQSCLWRAANSRELDYRSCSDLSSEFVDILEKLVSDYLNGSENGALDLMMGIAIRKIQITQESLKQFNEKIKSLKQRVGEDMRVEKMWDLADFIDRINLSKKSTFQELPI